MQTQGNTDIPSTKMVHETFLMQKEYFQSGETLDIEFRLEQLKNLKKALYDQESAIQQAIHNDMKKPNFELFTSEISYVYSEINFTIKKLKKWVKGKKLKTSFPNFKAKSRLIPEPYGNVLIIGPWNYQGIFIQKSVANIINNNFIEKNNGGGLILFLSNGSQIFNNVITENNDYGIGLFVSYLNHITNNNITKNHNDGIELLYTNKNFIQFNNIFNNTGFGINGNICFDNARNNYWGEPPPKRWIFTSKEVADIYTFGGFVAIRPFLDEPVVIENC